VANLTTTLQYDGTDLFRYVFEALVAVTDLKISRHLRYDVSVHCEDKEEDAVLIATRGFNEGEVILDMAALHFNTKENLTAFLRTPEGSHLRDSLRVCSKGVLTRMRTEIDAASPVDDGSARPVASSVYSIPVGVARYIQQHKGIGKRGVNAKIIVDVGSGANDGFLRVVASSTHKNGIAPRKAIVIDYGLAWAADANAGGAGGQKPDCVLKKMFAAIIKESATEDVDALPIVPSGAAGAAPVEGKGAANIQEKSGDKQCGQTHCSTGANWVVSVLKTPHAAKLVLAAGGLRLEPEPYGTKKKVLLNTPLALITEITRIPAGSVSAAGMVQWEFPSTAKAMVFEGSDFSSLSRTKLSDCIEQREASSVAAHEPSFNKSKAPQSLKPSGCAWMGADARTIQLLTLVQASPWLSTAWHVKKDKKEDQIKPCGIVIVNVKQLILEASGEHFDLVKG
jgi:hypothetical protein